MSFAAPFIREGLKQGLRYVYSGLKVQDKLIDATYRKTGLYNRGVVEGIKHGLIAGQVAGGVASLGLNAPDGIGNNDGIPFQKTRFRPKASKPYKTRYRQTTRYCPRRRFR